MPMLMKARQKRPIVAIPVITDMLISFLLNVTRLTNVNQRNLERNLMKRQVTNRAKRK